MHYIMSEKKDTELLDENPVADSVQPPSETCSTETASTDEAPAKPANKSKIDIFLKATGNAPIMKNKKWAVTPDKTIGKIVEFMRKYLHLDSKESLFLYVNQAFAPSPDQTVQNLYECFGTDGKLVLHYCKSPAWG